METIISDITTGNSGTRNHHSVKYTKLSDVDEPDDEFELDAISLKTIESSNSSSDEDLTGGVPGKRFTVEDAVENVGFGFFQIRLFVQCGLFTAADALEMMLLAVLSPVLRCEWGLDHYHVAFITTVVFVGMCVMAPVWGLMGDKFGRQKTLIMVTFWIGYFGLLTSFSPSYGWILVLRGLVGGGLAGSPQSFALLTEYLPSKYRAKMLNLTQISWAAGTMFEITIAAFTIPTLGWRWLLVFSSIPSFLIMVSLKFLPESARYLVAAGRKQDAMKILKVAADVNKSVLPEGTLKHSKSIKRGEPRDLFSLQYIRTTLQLWFLWFITAFSYYGMVLASAEILQLHNEKSGEHDSCRCNLLKSDDYTTLILSSVGEFVALPINLVLVDLIGRRWTGAVNLGGCAIFFILLQVNASQQVLTFFMFVVRGFSSGMFNFVYIYTAEVYPTTIRTLGIGISSSWARVGAMITPFVAQVLLDTSLTAAVWVYGSGCFLAAVCAVLLPIETKGRQLPQTTHD